MSEVTGWFREPDQHGVQIAVTVVTVLLILGGVVAVFVRRRSREPHP